MVKNFKQRAKLLCEKQEAVKEEIAALGHDVADSGERKVVKDVVVAEVLASETAERLRNVESKLGGATNG